MNRTSKRIKKKMNTSAKPAAAVAKDRTLPSAVPRRSGGLGPRAKTRKGGRRRGVKVCCEMINVISN